jgi:peptidoglycan/LPS O-acetylase OafA/YrhL
VATAALTALVIGPRVVASVTGHGGLVEDVLGDGFPLVTYVGFALLGAVGARLVLRGRDRAGEALVLGGLLTLAVAVATATGHPPDRHPGTLVGFVLPGVAATLLLYGTLARWSPPRLVDHVLRQASRHTLGIFFGHYLIYWGLRATGVLHQVAAGPSLALAVVITLAVVLVAPFVPTVPWSPRTGRRQAPKTSASTSGTGRSSCS